jgi:hypothetical protein
MDLFIFEALTWNLKDIYLDILIKQNQNKVKI